MTFYHVKRLLTDNVFRYVTQMTISGRAGDNEVKHRSRHRD